MTDLKTVLVNALHVSLTPDQDTVFGWNPSAVDTVMEDGMIVIRPSGHIMDVYNIYFDADRLAQAITDHLTPLSVWSMFYYGETLETFRSKEKAEAYLAAYLTKYPYLEGWCSVSEVIIVDDEAVDRLIEGLAGKAGE